MCDEDLRKAYLQMIRDFVLEFATSQRANVQKVLFVPQDSGLLEVYIFFEHDCECDSFVREGRNEALKHKLHEYLVKVNYFCYFPDDIIYQFDSHENVINNYKGSYYFRLL